MLSQRWLMSLNVVTTLGFWFKYNIGAMLTQWCLDVHTMLLAYLRASTKSLPQHRDRRWGNVGTNVVTTFPEHWSISWEGTLKRSAKLNQSMINSKTSILSYGTRMVKYRSVSMCVDRHRCAQRQTKTKQKSAFFIIDHSKWHKQFSSRFQSHKTHFQVMTHHIYYGPQQLLWPEQIFVSTVIRIMGMQTFRSWLEW